MPHYDVELTIKFRGEIHANSREEAESYAQDKWDTHHGAEMMYEYVERCDASEMTAEQEVDSCPADCDAFEEEEEEDEEEAE